MEICTHENAAIWIDIRDDQLAGSDQHRLRSHPRQQANSPSLRVLPVRILLMALATKR